ncbi:hypothetical protein PGB90_002026 [Kerria lacca]
MFDEWRSSVIDEVRSCRPLSSRTSNNVSRINTLIRENRRICISDLARRLNISVGSTYQSVYDELRYREVAARWIPKQLTVAHEEQRMSILLRYQAQGWDFLARTVAGHVTWIAYHAPELKQQSFQWKHTQFLSVKKFKRDIFVKKKNMATVFWDHAGVILIDFLSRGTIINSECYMHSLTNLRTALKNKIPGKLTKGVIFQHVNARPHVCQVTNKLLTSFRWEVMEPDLAPSDFKVFGKLKEKLAGMHFSSDAELSAAVTKCLQNLDGNFYRGALEELVLC